MTWLFALLLVLLPTQLGFHFWPEWSMVLGRKIDYLSPTVYLTDIIIFFILLFWFVESRPKFRLQTVIPIIVFALVNIWFSENQPVAFYKWIKVLEFGLLGFYIVRTKPHQSFVIWYLSFGILFSSLIAIGQFIFQHSLGGIFWWLGERTFGIDTAGIARIVLNGREMLRSYGTFSHPNVLGGFLAVTLPLLLRLKRSKWLYLVFSLGVIALALTFSRSAWVVGAIALAMINAKNKTVLFLVLIFVVGLILSMNIHLADESIVVRSELNTAAISIWRESPVIGVGLGNFLVTLPHVLPSRQVYFLQPVHNIYLLILAETGIIGLGAFLCFLWFSVRHATRNMSLVSLLLLGLIDHYLLTLQQGQLLFTLVLALGLIQ